MQKVGRSTTLWIQEVELRMEQLPRMPEPRKSYYLMKTTTDGGNVVNAGAINDLEFCHFSSC